jgi:hypothetical protein
MDLDELRMNDPLLGMDYPFNQYPVVSSAADHLDEIQHLRIGGGRVKINEFVHITWIIAYDYMLLQVDGETRLFSRNLTYMQLIKEAVSDIPPFFVGIAPGWGSTVTVKQFQVTPWSNAEQHDKPLALLLEHSQKNIQLNETFTLHSRVFPETAHNKKVTWSTDKDFIHLSDHGNGSVTIKVTEQGTAAVKGCTEEGGLSNVCYVRSVVPNLKTNLRQFNAISGDWSEEYEGMRGGGAGNTFMISSDQVHNFVYETDVVLELGGAAALLFRVQPNTSGFYCANIGGDRSIKLWRPGKDIAVVPAGIERNRASLKSGSA